MNGWINILSIGSLLSQTPGTWRSCSSKLGETSTPGAGKTTMVQHILKNREGLKAECLPLCVLQKHVNSKLGIALSLTHHIHMV